MPIEALIHYLSVGLTIVLPATCVAIGQGLAAKQMIIAANDQPEALPQLRRAFFLGIALNETAAIVSAVMGVLLLMNPQAITYDSALAELGIAFAIAIPCMFIGLLSSRPLQATFKSIARQPFFAKKSINLMLITISLMQMPGILGLIVSFIIRNQILNSAITPINGLQLLASGAAFGFGTIGSLIGLGIFAYTACLVIGENRESYPKVVSFTFISQALIETPILFALTTALIILNTTTFNSMSLIAAAIAISMSTFGPGISTGQIASAACQVIGNQPGLYTTVSNTSMLAQTLIHTSAIYGLVVALALLFFI